MNTNYIIREPFNANEADEWKEVVASLHELANRNGFYRGEKATMKMNLNITLPMYGPGKYLFLMERENNKIEGSVQFTSHKHRITVLRFDNKSWES